MRRRLLAAPPITDGRNPYTLLHTNRVHRE